MNDKDIVRAAELLAAKIIKTDVVYTGELLDALSHSLDWEFKNRLRRCVEWADGGISVGFYHQDSGKEFNFSLLDFILANYKGDKSMLLVVKSHLQNLVENVDRLIKEVNHE